MKSQNINLYLQTTLVLLFTSFGIINAQIEVEFNSAPNTAGVHLLLNEVNDADDWTRLFFKNDSDATNQWGLIAKPQTGAQDLDGIVDSPFAFAYSGIQKLALGSDGKLRINKQFVLPNFDGDDGQIFMTDGAGVVDFEWLNYTERQSSISDPTLRLHNPLDDSGHITFSNGGFADNRYAIIADPSGSDAQMRFSWGNVTNPAGVIDYLNLSFDTNGEAYVRSDQRLGVGTIPYYNGTSGFKFHVVSPDEPAAHFGEQSSAANGYVTVNRPTGLSGDIILKLRADGTTKVDFHEDEAEFFVPALFREEVRLVTADLIVGGDVTIDDLLIIEPRPTQPACDAGGDDNGSVIFYQFGGTKKLQVCVDGSWENLN